MQSKVIKTVYTFFVVPLLIVTAIKVCTNFRDYSFFNFRGINCFDNPVLQQNISEIIRSWPGFIAEEHYITTEDGYKVLVERSYSKITHATPIIIVHGIAMSALAWVNRGNVSLARLLGNLGYDVWMLNYRGTWYSKAHMNLSTSDRRYWKYNLNELGIHDVRSTIKLVNEKTQQKPIYIGFSMGTTGYFIYSTTYPEEAEQNVKAMIGLAPVTYYKSVRSVAKYTSFGWPVFKRFIYTVWSGEILPGYSVFLRPLVQFSGGMYIIQFFANLIFGDDYEQMDPGKMSHLNSSSILRCNKMWDKSSRVKCTNSSCLTYPQFATQLVDTAGVEVYSHYLQFYETEKFAKYDYGEEENLQVYGQPTPPLYDLSKIKVPVAMVVSENDWLATIPGAKQTYSQLQPSVRCGFHVIPHKKWNHIDFLIAKDLPKYLYKYLFNKIKDMEEGSCDLS